MAAVASPAPAQAPSTVPAPPAAQSAVPDQMVVNKLIWSAMAALDQANQTGNYSVLRDLGAPGFQSGSSVATLGTIFQGLRSQKLDLGNTLLVAPNLQIPPTIVEGGLLRLRGAFPLRPTPIGFDLLFQNVSGQWRIFGIAVAPIVIQTPQPSPTKR